MLGLDRCGGVLLIENGVVAFAIKRGEGLGEHVADGHPELDEVTAGDALIGHGPMVPEGAHHRSPTPLPPRNAGGGRRW